MGVCRLRRLPSLLLTASRDRALQSAEILEAWVLTAGSLVDVVDIGLTLQDLGNSELSAGQKTLAVVGAALPIISGRVLTIGNKRCIPRDAPKAAVEAASRARAQKYLGRNLKDSVDPAFDYVDDLGRTYDQMGNPAMIPHWAKQKQQFFNQIDRHLQKADFTVIDLSNFPKNIQDEVAEYVLKLPENLFDKVIPIGF